jgi:hypothetical protein
VAKSEGAGPHFQLYERQRIIFENNQLHRQIMLPQRKQFAHEHRQAATWPFLSAAIGAGALRTT